MTPFSESTSRNSTDRSPKTSSQKLAACACFTSSLFLAAATVVDDERGHGKPAKHGDSRLRNAFGGQYAKSGGETFRDGLRLATKTEQKAASDSTSEKRHFEHFYAFNDYFIQQHGPWISPTTILASERSRSPSVKVYFATCPITNITVKWEKDKKSPMEFHHVSKGCGVRPGRTFDYLFGILHHSANKALAIFSFKEPK